MFIGFSKSLGHGFRVGTYSRLGSGKSSKYLAPLGFLVCLTLIAPFVCYYVCVFPFVWLYRKFRGRKR